MKLVYEDKDPALLEAEPKRLRPTISTMLKRRASKKSLTLEHGVSAMLVLLRILVGNVDVLCSR